MEATEGLSSWSWGGGGGVILHMIKGGAKRSGGRTNGFIRIKMDPNFERNSRGTGSPMSVGCCGVSIENVPANPVGVKGQYITVQYSTVQYLLVGVNGVAGVGLGARRRPTMSR